MNKEEIKKAVLEAADRTGRDGYRKAYSGHDILTPENYPTFEWFPALFEAARRNEGLRQPVTASMEFGKAFADYATLPRDEFDAEYVVNDGPINQKTGKPYGQDTKMYREWEASVGRKVISSAQSMQLACMMSALKTRYGGEFDRDLCNLVFSCRDGMVKATVDAIVIEDGCIRLVDVKTTSDVKRFAESAGDMRYGCQQALICNVFGEAVGEALKGVRVIVEMAAVERCEPGAPSRCAVYRLSNALMDELKADVGSAVDRYCRYSTGGGWDDGLSDTGTYTIG